MEVLEVQNRSELRQWYLQNNQMAKECWVVVKYGCPVGDDAVWYLDAVEEALCFGWIDSVVKKTAEGFPAQRFSPRRRGSHWSELNKERCRRLEKLGLMTDFGRAVLPDMSESGFVIDDEILEALKSDPEIWHRFNSFPPLYRRVRIDTIQLKKKQPQIYKNRLKKFLENTKKGVMFGAWNDNGRL